MWGDCSQWLRNREEVLVNRTPGGDLSGCFTPLVSGMGGVGCLRDRRESQAGTHSEVPLF